MKKNFNKIIILCIALVLTLCVCACNGSNSGELTSSDTSGNTDDIIVEELKYNTLYNPTTFDKNSVSYTESQIKDGLVLVKNTIKKNNNDISIIYALEIDLSKVEIKAGTKGNKTYNFNWEKEVPYQQALDYEKTTGKNVLASINADFFGAKCVNAFVKDGYIIKDSHNDNGNYDYLKDASDVPASAPMLFGVKEDKAQISPLIKFNKNEDITLASVKQKYIQSKLFYTVTAKNKTIALNDENLELVFERKIFERKSISIKLDITNGLANAVVLEKQQNNISQTVNPTENTAYLYAKQEGENYNFLNNLGVGDKIALGVGSEDGIWNGYDTILGCRQALVIEGKIPNTVTLENTNGAQRNDIPRTAIGIKNDGMVVLFAVESLYYGNKASVKDTHGLSLPELSDFMCFYNIRQGANFDGGGSTQLVLNTGDDAKVVIRSSDTGSEGLLNTRKVMNSFLVVEK